MKLTEEQLARMKHALGMDNINPRDFSYHAYRNYSVYNDPHPVWEELVSLDLATRRHQAGDFVCSYVYNVTPKGMQEVANATGFLIKYTLEFEPEDIN